MKHSWAKCRLASSVRCSERVRRQAAQESEVENARLRRLLAEAELNKAMLKELTEAN